MRDFTRQSYRELLLAFRQAGYAMIPFEDYCRKKDLPARYVILRHDVDMRPAYSLAVAQIEHELGARASYYFRVGKESNDPEVIRQIAALGHEVGYHYEDMAIANGDMQKAYAHFQQWLAYFRGFYPVVTCCMHGAPTSKWDGRTLWKQYDYKALGLIGEPYFDADFTDLLYLTDTGRCWDGYKVSVRDKIPGRQDEWVRQGLTFHRTQDIIARLSSDFPVHLMLTTHPQRWTDQPLAWWRELVVQELKNCVKRWIVKTQR